MRIVLQRVSQASVRVDGTIVGQIGRGLLVLLGIGHNDTPADALVMAEKVAQLRVFADASGRFNNAAADVGGSILVVSQFTLYADTRRGRRPGFSDAARPELAAPLVDAFCVALRAHALHVETGTFGAHMDVALVNDGPVTIILDSATGEPRRQAGGAP